MVTRLNSTIFCSNSAIDLNLENVPVTSITEKKTSSKVSFGFECLVYLRDHNDDCVNTNTIIISLITLLSLSWSKYGTFYSSTNSY